MLKFKGYVKNYKMLNQDDNRKIVFFLIFFIIGIIGIILLLFSTKVSAQVVQDNFDSYSPGVDICIASGGYWTYTNTDNCFLVHNVSASAQTVPNIISNASLPYSYSDHLFTETNTADFSFWFNVPSTGNNPDSNYQYSLTNTAGTTGINCKVFSYYYNYAMCYITGSPGYVNFGLDFTLDTWHNIQIKTNFSAKTFSYNFDFEGWSQNYTTLNNILSVDRIKLYYSVNGGEPMFLDSFSESASSPDISLNFTYPTLFSILNQSYCGSSNINFTGQCVNNNNNQLALLESNSIPFDLNDIDFNISCGANNWSSTSTISLGYNEFTIIDKDVLVNPSFGFGTTTATVNFTDTCGNLDYFLQQIYPPLEENNYYTLQYSNNWPFTWDYTIPYGTASTTIFELFEMSSDFSTEVNQPVHVLCSTGTDRVNCWDPNNYGQITMPAGGTGIVATTTETYWQAKIHPVGSYSTSTMYKINFIVMGTNNPTAPLPVSPGQEGTTCGFWCTIFREAFVPHMNVIMPHITQMTTVWMSKFPFNLFTQYKIAIQQLQTSSTPLVVSVNIPLTNTGIYATSIPISITSLTTSDFMSGLRNILTYVFVIGFIIYLGKEIWALLDFFH